MNGWKDGCTEDGNLQNYPGSDKLARMRKYIQELEPSIGNTASSLAQYGSATRMGIGILRSRCGIGEN